MALLTQVWWHSVRIFIFRRGKVAFFLLECSFRRWPDKAYPCFPHQGWTEKCFPEPAPSSCFPSPLTNVCRALPWPQPWHIWQSAGSVCVCVCCSVCVCFSGPYRCLPISQTAERSKPAEVKSTIFSWGCLICPLSSSAREHCQYLSLIDDKIYIINLIANTALFSTWQ